jgi:type II secretory pathway pseudopilin PulG
MKYKHHPANSAEKGASIVEIVIALVIIAVLSAISLPYIVNYKKLYKSEDQALKMIDLMREAAQVAVTERRTIRFEIDLTDNAVLLIDQSASASGNLIKKIPLEETKEVRVDVIPDGITKPDTNYNDITFAADTVGHLDGTTTVTGHNIWAARFKRDGSVVSVADTPISVNIYVWPPVEPGSTEARNDTEIRAITMFGGSGALRYWKYDSTEFVPHQ